MKLKVKTVIGGDDPLDIFMLIPLICDWGVPRNCAVALRGEECGAPLARLYVLEEPVEGHAVVGMCRKHDAEFRLGAMP